MENNILTQIYNDPKSKKLPLLEYVQMIVNEDLNTKNCKLEDERYLNVEDERYLYDSKKIGANEISFCFENNPIFRVGNCIRKLYFQINNAIGEDKDISDIEMIERNHLVVKQWIDKFKLVGIYEEPKKQRIKTAGIEIESTEDGFINDPSSQNNINYALMIKPVNDTAFSILNVCWAEEPMILPIHIPEIILNLLILKKPIKLIYVGKNNPSKVQEFNIGTSNKKLKINGVVQSFIEIDGVLQDIKEIGYALNNNMIPERKYISRILDPADAYKLADFNIVTKKEVMNLINGKEYLYWGCEKCKYSNICNSY